MTVLTPVVLAERTVRRSGPSDNRPSQRDLVAMSLLLCPDGRPPRDRR
jgi:hypothetical protein